MRRGIIGGGQGGIGLVARLRRLGVPTIVIEKNQNPGDSWRNRYKSLHLHDPVWYDHLPYLKFPDDWPVFAAKDKIGDWLEHYTRIMELNYWGGTECVGAEYDDGTQEWVVRVVRDGSPVTLRPQQLVFALRVSGYPNIPAFDGAQSFLGEQRHSSQHPGGGDWTGKKAVVIGSNNSAHDICADLWEHGADVTMVQRSSTHIARSESLMDLALGDLYSEKALANGVTTEKADLLFASLPYRILPEAQVPVYQEMATRDAQFYSQLEAAGFDLDFGVDGSGLFVKYLRRGSGYYIDVGANAGDTGQTRQKTLVRGRGSCAICGNQPTSPTSGSTAATCTRAGTTPPSWRCSSRPGWRGWRRRCTNCSPATTPAERKDHHEGSTFPRPHGHPRRGHP